MDIVFPIFIELRIYNGTYKCIFFWIFLTTSVQLEMATICIGWMFVAIHHKLICTTFMAFTIFLKKATIRIFVYVGGCCSCVCTTKFEELFRWLALNNMIYTKLLFHIRYSYKMSQ